MSLTVVRRVGVWEPSRGALVLLASLVACSAPIADGSAPAADANGATDAVLSDPAPDAAPDVLAADATPAVDVAPDAPADATAWVTPDTVDTWPTTCGPPAGLPPASPNCQKWFGYPAPEACTATCGSAVPAFGVCEGDLVVPGVVLHLTGGVVSCPSTVPATGPFFYSWTVAQPAASAVPLLPNANVMQPTFAPQIPGTYTFCLSVKDASGVSACKPHCQDITVQADLATLHVQLLWRTPADADPHDDGPNVGADLDLHLASPYATAADFDCDGSPDPWFNVPYDCAWTNVAPNWGSPDPNVDDDPRLDFDDTDGTGPENIDLNAPQGTVDQAFFYAVGVHYFSDHGFGASYATVDVFLLGTLMVHLANVPMHSGDLWYAGGLRWPNQFTGGTGAAFVPCLATGNPCKKTGKLWDPAGCSRCITPCYPAPAGFKVAGPNAACP